MTEEISIPKAELVNLAKSLKGKVGVVSAILAQFPKDGSDTNLDEEARQKLAETLKAMYDGIIEDANQAKSLITNAMYRGNLPALNSHV